MHFRVSGSHSPWVSDDITAQQWREGEKNNVELKYTSATNDGETFTSVLLCEALWGLPQHTGADEYIHGDSAVRLNRETRASGCIPALCYQICHPSALRSLSCLWSSGVLCLCVAWLRVATVSEKHVGGVYLYWRPGECQISGRRRRKNELLVLRADSGRRMMWQS